MKPSLIKRGIAAIAVAAFAVGAATSAVAAPKKGGTLNFVVGS